MLSFIVRYIHSEARICRLFAAIYQEISREYNFRIR